MTPEQSAVAEIERILKGADSASVLADAGAIALAFGVAPECFMLALGVSGAVAPEESLREFMIALAGRSPEAKATIQNVGIRFYDTVTGSILPMRDIGEELNAKLQYFGRNVMLAIVETIFGGGARTAVGLMQLAKEEAA